VWTRALLALCFVNGGCGNSDHDGSAAPSSQLSAIQREVFTGSCALSDSCHRGDSTPSGLNLEAPVHAKLVGVPANSDSSRILVVAGDPSSSYLYEKISRGTPSLGMPMPPNAQPLSNANIERIRAWITAGALDD
jgi:hypothetical protein